MIVATALDKVVKIVFEDFIDLPIQDPISLKHKTGRIAKGGGMWLNGGLHVRANQGLFFGDRTKADFTYHQAVLKNRPMFLKKNAIPNTPATMTCTR
jgi:hypothetical protein